MKQILEYLSSIEVLLTRILETLQTPIKIEVDAVLDDAADADAAEDRVSDVALPQALTEEQVEQAIVHLSMDSEFAALDAYEQRKRAIDYLDIPF